MWVAYELWHILLIINLETKNYSMTIFYRTSSFDILLLNTVADHFKV